MNYLKQPRLLPVKGGTAQASKVLQVAQKNIADHPWVDALHMGSEVTSYYTRYLATVKDRIAIIVTFSAFKTSYTRYSNDFIRAITSLRVTATKDLLAPKAKLPGGGEHLGSGIPTAQPPGGPGGLGTYPPESSTLGEGAGTNMRQTLGLALIIIGAALLGVWWVWSRKKSKRKKPGRR
jgi:hypothetical protein